MQPALAPHPRMSMQNSAQDHADQVLHDQLLAAQQHLSGQEGRSQGGAQNQNSNIDPAISGNTMLAAANSQGPPLGQVMPQIVSGVPDAAGVDRKQYGKRELSTSKRAAQNRAAQRAFRQRKEGYIRQLEEKVGEYKVLSESYKALQSENYQLREYIIGLQSRLIDSQNEVPELPGNIDLNQPRPDPPTMTSPSHHPVPPGPPPGASSGSPNVTVPPGQQGQPSGARPNQTSDDINQLNRIAVAGLGIPKNEHEGYPGGETGVA